MVGGGIQLESGTLDDLSLTDDSLILESGSTTHLEPFSIALETIESDTFFGDGDTTVFTLTNVNASNDNNVIVRVNNGKVETTTRTGDTFYSLVGQTLTFTTAPIDNAVITVTAESTDSLLLDGTDSNSQDAGDNVLLDSTDGGSDAGSNVELEEGASSYATLSLPTRSELAGGTDDYAVTAGEIKTAYDRFEDTESLDINLVLGGRGGGAGDTQSSQDTHVTMLTNFVEKRRDCVAFVSPFRSATVAVNSHLTQTDNVINAFDQCPSSSYVVFDSGYKYMYDKYNDVFRFVPLNGDIAGLCANTDQVADSFFSPAGFNRGRIRGAIKLSYNPNGAERDRLYRARVNPVVNFAGQGVVLFGDKTALDKPSAFDRINVRRLFLLLEKAIATAAKFQLFEFNDEFTRAQFRNLIEPFLRDVQGRRGITDFSVLADASNNTGEVIDRNEFVADIFVKPSRSINFITLSFVATRTGVSFSEVGG